MSSQGIHSQKLKAKERPEDKRTLHQAGRSFLGRRKSVTQRIHVETRQNTEQNARAVLHVDVREAGRAAGRHHQKDGETNLTVPWNSQGTKMEIFWKLEEIITP